MKTLKLSNMAAKLHPSKWHEDARQGPKVYNGQRLLGKVAYP